MQPLSSSNQALSSLYGTSSSAVSSASAATSAASPYTASTSTQSSSAAPTSSSANVQAPEASLASLMSMMLQLMQALLTMFSQSSNIFNGATDQITPAEQTNSTSNQTGQQSSTGPVLSPVLSKEDLIDYVLAGSKGGTAGTNESIEGQFARPGSRFAEAGANEFDGVTAKAYSAQFKAYAMGLPAAFIPGQTTVEEVAGNIEKAQTTQFTQEAQILGDVAAVYRGDFGNASAYNNPKLKELLISWGRSDIASQQNVGVTDVESVGGVMKALNEEKDPAIRQAWLQQIFDFQNNTPSSPSGAVPNVAEYQKAISLVTNGTINQLVNNYLNGVKTNNPI